MVELWLTIYSWNVLLLLAESVVRDHERSIGRRRSNKIQYPVFEKGLSEFYKESVKSLISKLDSMRKRFNISVLTISRTNFCICSRHYTNMHIYAQLELPPEEVSILNETATNNTNNTISNSTNDITEIVVSC
jgi:hypothetical protein